MNRKIIVATFIIGGSGVVNALSGNGKITPIIIGSYVFILIMSVMDAFGGTMSQLAGALSMVAMTYVILTVFPWSTVIKAIQGGGKGSIHGASGNFGKGTIGGGASGNF